MVTPVLLTGTPELGGLAVSERVGAMALRSHHGHGARHLVKVRVRVRGEGLGVGLGVRAP